MTRCNGAGVIEKEEISEVLSMTMQSLQEGVCVLDKCPLFCSCQNNQDHATMETRKEGKNGTNFKECGSLIELISDSAALFNVCLL